MTYACLISPRQPHIARMGGTYREVRCSNQFAVYLNERSPIVCLYTYDMEENASDILYNITRYANYENN